ncbi:hypothetical protein [Paenisporosarcina indica]|uniref:hypothetical protein n=1 Tax=Paenisporosarcina indica TaxID=650093 RepID=UPI00094FE779|nr:hypothetical protein [Paenisporosarcina indica]
MAKTQSRKQREHLFRNSGRDVTQFRGENDFSTHVRKTKTKQEKLNSKESKYKKQFRRGEQPNGIAFLFALKPLRDKHVV